MLIRQKNTNQFYITKSECKMLIKAIIANKIGMGNIVPHQAVHPKQNIIKNSNGIDD